MKIGDYVIDCQESILAAMEKIDNNRKGTVYISEDEKIAGVITDGDIRRYILKNGNLNHAVITIANKKLTWITVEDEKNVEKLLKEKQITSIPVLDSSRHLIKIYFTDDVVSDEEKHLNLPIVIMAGGQGTRLYPYTRILPKPLIPVGDQTITEHIMDSFGRFGCYKFDMIVNYKKNFIKSYFLDYQCKYKVDFVEEEQFLGTGGGLKLLEGKYTSTFFVTNCDILVDADYSAIIDYHKKNKNIVTMVCAMKNMVIPYGTVEMTEDGRALSLIEKPKLSFVTNTGLYVLEPEFIEAIPENTFIHITDLIQQCIDEGRNVGVYKINEEQWLDMGQMEELENMKRKLNVE